MEYMAHYEKSPRMWSQGLHAHEYYEIYIHLDGGRYYCVNDQVYELKPNQLLIIPPLHMHGLVCDRDLVDYERCYLFLSLELLQKCDLSRVNLSGLLEATAKKKKFLFTLSEEVAEQCKKNLQAIEALDSSTEKKGFEIYSHIFQVLQIVIDNLVTSRSVKPQKVNDNPIIEILHYINEHYTQNISVKSISQEFHISESSLSHKFKEYINKGVYEYILYKRVILAKELMYTTDSLTEIAFKCGFSDYSNFLRVFEKQTGISPKEYRSNN